ncbi:reverse transcriptase/maturase family protein [Candidatus Nanohalobium constans]|uniref:RNA-dependent DNA polymerase (Reverse transcriptase) n=1 Tax=Candidatus Nanohalobium constans TaxID=2565781 RepID=A0A5Q0UEX0_9ARCH|nr:reverse transcriptase/maturase family protein [Candidatus Nanohalobium constans]QGA80034.1 RNA-dependent DNA polymerase (Reverse transcriptase) [Candidatus Nanohalobium constans]
MVNSFSKDFETVAGFQPLYKGYKKARKGKRYSSEVLAFSESLEDNLFDLSNDLLTQSYCPKGFKEFKLFDPKEREIKAPYFRDRIVHRSLHISLEPFFDKRFIEHSYACRKGKGTHAGVDKAQEFMNKSDAEYFLKCDVEDYFGSVDHKILTDMLDRKIRDDRIVDLVRTILADSGDKGMPIGTLYSQLFANIYLNKFDHFVKQSLQADYYVRYMDDFVFFSDSKQRLHQLREASKGFLRKELDLSLPFSKTTLEPIQKGLIFLGYRIFPNHRKLRKRNKLGFKERHGKQRSELQRGELTFSELRDSIESWKGHAEHADTENLCENFLGSLS